MDLIKFEISLKFEDTTKTTTPALTIYKKLGGVEIPKNRKPNEPGARIRKAKEKFLIRWHYDTCRILYEDNANYEYCIKNAISMLETISAVAPIKKLDLLKLSLYWILPVQKYNFKSLEGKYRNTFIKMAPIFENCVDSTIVIDMEYQNGILSHQSGAMNKDQLKKQYREFDLRPDHPGLFLFLHTSMEYNKVFDYSSKNMEKFLSESFIKCKDHSDGFEAIIGGAL